MSINQKAGQDQSQDVLSSSGRGAQSMQEMPVEKAQSGACFQRARGARGNQKACRLPSPARMRGSDEDVQQKGGHAPTLAEMREVEGVQKSVELRSSLPSQTASLTLGFGHISALLRNELSLFNASFSGLCPYLIASIVFG